MNIGSFMHAGHSTYGVFEGQIVRPAAATLRARFPTLRDLLEHGSIDHLRDGTCLDAPIPVNDIAFLPPIPNPRKIICVGMNYPKPYPVEGVAPPDPEHIILFGKERDTLLAHQAALEIPLGEPAQSFDYEGEIAVIIGRQARHVPPQEALKHVLGYSVFNDGSVRDWQKHSIYAGKNFARSGAWGPWITTADALPDAKDLHLTVRLNDEIVQSASGAEMIFSVAEQISYASSLFPLRPGDIIATGSPDGTGGSRSPKRFLKEGDHLSMTISGIGTLLNTVSAGQSGG